MKKYPIIGPTVFTVGLILFLLWLPSPFKSKTFHNTERVPMKIESVFNENIQTIGVVRQGEQICEVRVLKGSFENQRHSAVNLMTGSLEQDKVFEVGDVALGVIDYEDEAIRHIQLIDHYRIPYEMILLAVFIVFLITFAGWIGARSFLSFICSVLIIWKILIPGFLLGKNPLLLALVATALLTIVIILLVYGLDKRSLSAISGSLLGSVLTLVISNYAVTLFKINGAVMPHSESLIYAGFGQIDLTSIFIASIVIACSGAMMDVAVDITASIHELVQYDPNISTKQAIKSGLNVGRAIMGTMTTTLLLAYSGSFMGLLMVFTAQGTPLLNILNLRMVSSEILHTLVGSIGLISVAPFTAITSGILLTHSAPSKPFLKVEKTLE